MGLSPNLVAGQTRIILGWEKNTPMDLEISVMAIKKNGGNLCKTSYSKQNGCTEVSLDLDNLSGGLNGIESVTLQDSKINSKYTYLIAVTGTQSS